MSKFIKVDNYIIKVSGIEFIKTYRDKKGNYYIGFYTEDHTISIYYENYTKRDKDFKRIFKEINE